MKTLLVDKTRHHVAVIRLNPPQHTGAMAITSRKENRKPVYADLPRTDARPA